MGDGVREGRVRPDGHRELVVDRGHVLNVMRLLRDDPASACDMLIDICGVDYPDRDDRFEVVYHLANLNEGRRYRIRVPVKESDASVPSVFGIWKAADWFEREAFDLFGIRFEGHPNLKRILTH